VEHVDKAGQLTILARDASMVLVDLGMPPIPRIPRDPHMDNDIMEVVGIIQEHLRGAYTSGHGPWD
jgi:hypothetical protein